MAPRWSSSMMESRRLSKMSSWMFFPRVLMDDSEAHISCTPAKITSLHKFTSLRFSAMISMTYKMIKLYFGDLKALLNHPWESWMQIVSICQMMIIINLIMYLSLWVKSSSEVVRIQILTCAMGANHRWAACILHQDSTTAEVQLKTCLSP